MTSQHAAAKQSRARDIIVVIVALIWLLAFGGHFFARPLEDNSELGRLDVLADSGWLLMDDVFSAPNATSENSGWRYVPQRLDLLLVAAAMLMAAWTTGRLCLRCLRVASAAPSDQLVMSFGLGFSAWTLATLGLGLAGALWRSLFLVLMVASIVAEGVQWLRSRRISAGNEKQHPVAFTERRYLEGPKLPIAICILVAPFLLAMLLGAMLPTTDFDVKEYHLQGPKEWLQQGRITFLPHNAYTSFPFLTEMLSLWGMVLRGDWYRGALIGQVVLMTFAPLSAVAIFAICRRVGATAGWIGVGVFLSIPWIYRISVIAYTEGGLTFFLAATFLSWIELRALPGDPDWRRRVLVCGLLAGSAMACKYPGLVSVTLPIGLAVVVTAIRRGRRLRLDEPLLDRPTIDVVPKHGTASAGQAVPSRISEPLLPDRSSGTVREAIVAAAIFSVGAAITFGPWALKNLVETGNPVYPLGYTVFGGRDWTPELNEKWRKAHEAKVDWQDPGTIPSDLQNQAEEVAVNSVWQSPLVFGFAPLALISLWPLRRPGDVSGWGRPSLTLVLILYSVWLFLTWWGLTHRIDRFWLPMLPIVCALAGIGGAEVVQRLERLFEHGHRILALSGGLTLASLIILATSYNLTIAVSAFSGFNGYLLDESVARRIAMQQTPSIALLQQRLPPDARVLLVGEAAVFDAPFDLRYNTVFDFELLQDLATDDPLSLHQPEIPLKSRDEILGRLRAEGITHVFVNWLEILRYREPGSYTYTDFISPRTMQKLVDLGVLIPVRLTPQESLAGYADLSPGKRQEVERWGPDLKTTFQQDGETIPVIIGYALYTVADPTRP